MKKTWAGDAAVKIPAPSPLVLLARPAAGLAHIFPLLDVSQTMLMDTVIRALALPFDSSVHARSHELAL